MRRALALSLALPFLALPLLHAQATGRAVVEAAARAMGGADRVAAVRTLVLEGTGEQFNLGQNVTPEAPLPRYEVTRWERAYDFAGNRWRSDVRRVPRFVTPNPAEQRFRAAYDSVGWDVLPNDTRRRTTARVDADRAEEVLFHPLGLLQAAMRDDARLSAPVTSGGVRRVRMTLRGVPLMVDFDAATRLPLRVRRTVHNAMLGDAVLETRFAEWAAREGLRLPSRITQRLDGQYLLSDLRVAATRLGADVADVAAPADLRAAPAFAAPAVTVTVDTVAPGVWHLTGSTHHSVVVEMRDHLLLVEAPQSEERTLAVIRAARALRPGKPLRAVVATHHHFDHAGGLRAAMASGLTVITHQSNKPFLDALSRRPFTLVPDSLARAPRRAVVEGFGARRLLTDGTRRVELHHIPGSAHARSMLLVYLPAERILTQADAFNAPLPNAPPPPSYPFARNLVETIDRLGLQVERLVSIHGPIVPMSELRRAAGG